MTLRERQSCFSNVPKGKQIQWRKAPKDLGVDTTGLDLASVDPVFTTYVVTKGDIENVGEVPSDPAAQAQVKWLPYQSVAEAIAEKFHCDLDFLRELESYRDRKAQRRRPGHGAECEAIRIKCSKGT